MEAEPGEVVEVQRILSAACIQTGRMQKELRFDKIDLFLTKTQKREKSVALALSSHLLFYWSMIN